MKVMTILGTRPEIIRLSRVIPHLDRLCDHVLVHTGQNYDRTLNEIFFDQLGIRSPDHLLECKSGSPMGQVGAILTGCEHILLKEKPDRLLLLGDTNSAISALAAKRLGIPVFHMEAGNRCYDDRVPEEVNRRVIDHCSDVLMPYTERSRSNLLREGIAGQRIFVTGNPIREVLDHYADRIDASTILDEMGLTAKSYFLVTLHRAENVDIESRLSSFVDTLRRLAAEYDMPVICSTHPRTRSQLDARGVILGNNVRFVEPFGLFDFVHLEKHAFCVLSDSGTVQEECSIFGVPNVTLRDVTERPETVETGSNIISGVSPDSIFNAVKAVSTLDSDWEPPAEYQVKNVSRTVVKIVLGYHRELPGRHVD